MPNFEGTITDFVVGDDFIIERTITSVPSGQTISNAWFTVKRKVTDLDASAVIQKAITASFVTGIGQIDDTGADGTGHVIFYLVPNETVLFTPYSEYLYDIQIKLSGGAISTPEIGVLIAFPQMTRTG